MVDAWVLLPVFVSLFAIVDPIAVVPVFLALTQQQTAPERRKVALQAVVAGAGVLFFFGIAGDYIFEAFGITIPAFRVAGGVLLFKYAYDMLHGERPGADGTNREIGAAAGDSRREALSLAVTPLGVPLLTGPGAIVTMMVFLSGEPDPMIRVGIFGAALVVFLLTYAMLLGSSTLDRLLGPNGLMITMRLMGLILAAVAVQFVVVGIAQLWQQTLGASPLH
jgi:multiple antibiotic resistance protein